MKTRKMVDRDHEVLIWLLKTNTTRINAWLADRLRAGHTSALFRAAPNTHLGATPAHQAALGKMIDLSD